QSSHDAAQSCDEHVEIVQALEKGDLILAEKLMQTHIGNVQATLKLHASSGDPLAELRNALSPVSASLVKPKGKNSAQDLHTSLSTTPPEEPSTYLGALL
ncbi:MAG: FCD domain-containing protein, partial [Rhodoferax sp.]